MEIPTTLSGATLLLIDDNPANLSVLTHALAVYSVRILVAQQGEAGLQIAQRVRPDLILLDVQLPGMDGFEICQRLKSDPTTADIPVLFMSVRLESADKLRGFQAGAVDYITKPFQTEEVLARVTTHLRLRQLTQKLQEHNEQLQAAEAALRIANEDLDRRVQERTAELVRANHVLQQEIAERQRIERALATERNLLRTLIDNVPDYIFVKDIQSRFMLANNALMQYLNVSTPDELLGKTDFDFFPREQAARYYTDEQIIMQNDWALINKEEINTLNQGDGERWVLTTKVPVRDAHGQVIELVGISRDITTRKRLEAQFLQAQKMEGIGQLAGGIAHDFNNLLTAIVGYAELADAALPPDDPLRADLRAIHDAASHATALTRQLLIFARKQVLEPKILNINELVAHLEKLLRRLIGEDVELMTLLAPDPWPVRVDSTQIEQVLVNLVVNARDAMPDGGKLTIETANVVLDAAYIEQHLAVAPGRYIVLVVSDTGMGMPPEVQARIFEPFFTTKEAGKGTGLGLSTSYGIVKQHGGHIWVYSEAGQGTTFKIYLPRATEESDAQSGEVQPASPAGGYETILLVEDNQAVRQLAVRVLRERGYRVLEASDGVDALRIAGEHSGTIDLLVADVVMPRMGGTTLLDYLRATHPQIKVLFMSGYTDQMIVHRGILPSSFAFLQKPFAPELLARKVREVLVAANEHDI